MGYPINNSKLKRNKVARIKPTNRTNLRLKPTNRTNLRLNRNMMCRAPYVTEILPNGSWKGKTCFLIGGGPSLKGFDFSPLKNKLTIGVNKSFIAFPTTINYAMDDRFYRMVAGTKKDYPVNNLEWQEIQEQWLAYKGIKLFMRRSRKEKYDSSVHIIKDLGAKKISFDLNQGVHGGNNSGFGALMLAVGLGATRIGLLGYDLKVQKNQKKIKTHWHNGYSFDGSSDHFQRKLDKFKMCFEEFAPAIRQQGIEVVNLNLDSALTCFPKQEMEIFLK